MRIRPSPQCDGYRRGCKSAEELQALARMSRIEIVPVIAVRQFTARCEFHVDHPAMAGCARLGWPTRMREERPHCQHVAGGGKNGHRRAIWRFGVATNVRARQHLQGTIYFGHVVQMNSQCQHLLEDIVRRFHMWNTCLDCSIAKPLARQRMIREGDRQIPVPGKAPIAVGRLVEEEATNEAELWTQDGG